MHLSFPTYVLHALSISVFWAHTLNKHVHVGI
jgi:hypothetical protein